MTKPPPDFLSADWGWSGFRRDALQLIAWGYRLAEARIRQVHEEEDITGLIRKGINAKIDTLDDSLWFYYTKYFIANEDPVDDDDISLGKRRKFVDISVEYSGTRPRIRYRFEAKRCARKKYNSKYTIPWYADGIADYIKGLYARDDPEAGMIGLIQSDNMAHWKSELAAWLSSNSSLACQRLLTEVDIVADLPGTCVSTHRRNNGVEIDLYHVFLDCIPD